MYHVRIVQINIFCRTRKCQARENKGKMQCALTHLMPVWPSSSLAPHIILYLELRSGNLSGRAASNARLFINSTKQNSLQAKTIYRHCFPLIRFIVFHHSSPPIVFASYIISRPAKGCFSSKLPLGALLWGRYLWLLRPYDYTYSQLKDRFSHICASSCKKRAESQWEAAVSVSLIQHTNTHSEENIEMFSVLLIDAHGMIKLASSLRDYGLRALLLLSLSNFLPCVLSFN